MADKHLHAAAMNLVDRGKALGMERRYVEALAAEFLNPSVARYRQCAAHRASVYCVLGQATVRLATWQTKPRCKEQESVGV
jgi:hypothetical protein